MKTKNYKKRMISKNDLFALIYKAIEEKVIVTIQDKIDPNDEHGQGGLWAYHCDGTLEEEVERFAEYLHKKQEGICEIMADFDQEPKD